MNNLLFRRIAELHMRKLYFSLHILKHFFMLRQRLFLRFVEHPEYALRCRDR